MSGVAHAGSPLGTLGEILEWIWRAPFHRFIHFIVLCCRFFIGLFKGSQTNSFWTIAAAEEKAIELFRRNNPTLESESSSTAGGAASSSSPPTENPADMFEDDYHRLVFSRLEADLSSSQLGTMANTIPFAKIYERKLRIEQYWRTHLDAQSVQLPRPVWIIGLPRTGSTWLHKMLGSDPSGRALRSWEIKYPVPLEDCETGSKEERQAKVKTHLSILYKLAPRIRHIHYVEAMDPDEDVAGFLDASMVDWFAWGMVAMEETYAWYVDGQNSKPQYANYRKLVQCLLHQDDPKEAQDRSHLVFKSPHHLLALPSIVDEFPGSVFVWLHRNPLQVTASCCSMNLAVLDYFSPHFFRKASLGRRTLDRLAKSVNVAMEMRERLEKEGKARFVDVYYEDLKSDPLATIAAMYDDLELEFTKEVADSILAATTSPHKSSKHRYSLDDFALSEQDVTQAFSKYLTRFPEVLKITALPSELSTSLS